MKMIFALSTALVASAAYSSEHDRNMIEFDAESIIQGAYSFDKSKTPGEKADNDSELNLQLNYARATDRFSWLQIAGTVNYLKDTGDTGDNENYGFLVGAIYNHWDDLLTSPYASFYTGLSWNNQTGGTSADDEVLTSVFALGKRMSLEYWGLKHLTYSPEIALKSENSTTGGNLEYAQSLELRFLQFAVFF